MKKIFYTLLVVIALFLSGCSREPKSLNFVGFIENNKEFKFIKPSVIEDTYILNLQEDKNDYFSDNIIDLMNIVPISSYTVRAHTNVLLDLKEMFDKEKYQKLIIRRGYLTEEQSKEQLVYDHTTGYDIDLFVEGKNWTDFTGKEANELIKNSYKYGFVLRYPNKKDKNYQPWHYRYVGKIHAKIINDENLTLPQYLNKLLNFDNNKIYKLKDTNDYIYKVSKDNILVPKGYNYSISSINDDYYVITFNTDKSVNIKEVDNYNAIVNKNLNTINILSDLMLVNNNCAVKNFKDIKLVSLTKYLTEDNNPEYLLDEKALIRLQSLLELSNKLDKNTTYVTSSYRTDEQQKELYNNGKEGYVQKPGHSEHQIGLAVDISNSFKDHTKFLKTAQGTLINSVAHQYGFILRYPNGKKDITGIEYEPWHFRYVGELHATYIKENNMVLEEYLNTFELDKFYEVSFNNEKYIFYKSKLDNEQIPTFKDINDIYYLCNDEYLSIIKE